MKKNRHIAMALCAVALLLGLSSMAQATLMDRGNGMIYDSDQNLTWLQDANYAMTSEYDVDGLMNWSTATGWAAGLSFGGYSDWRLPTVTDSDNDGCHWANSGTDCGYNVDTTTGELAYLFHDVLGNESWVNPDGSRNSTGCPDSSPYCVQNTGADGVNFLNLQSYAYWSGTEYAPGTSLRRVVLQFQLRFPEPRQ